MSLPAAILVWLRLCRHSEKDSWTKVHIHESCQPISALAPGSERAKGLNSDCSNALVGSRIEGGLYHSC